MMDDQCDMPGYARGCSFLLQWPVISAAFAVDCHMDAATLVGCMRLLIN